MDNAVAYDTYPEPEPCVWSYKRCACVVDAVLHVKLNDLFITRRSGVNRWKQ